MSLTNEELQLVIRALANQFQNYPKEPDMETLFMKVLRHLGYVQ